MQKEHHNSSLERLLLAQIRRKADMGLKHLDIGELVDCYRVVDRKLLPSQFGYVYLVEDEETGHRIRFSIERRPTFRQSVERILVDTRDGLIILSNQAKPVIRFLVEQTALELLFLAAIGALICL